MSECPCCGQPMPSKAKLTFIESGGIVTRNGSSARLTKLEYRIAYALRNRNLRIEQVIDEVYRDDPGGGPVCADKCVHTSMCRMNKKLVALGVKVCADIRRSNNALLGIHLISDA